MMSAIHPLGSSLASVLRGLGQRPYLLAGFLILANTLFLPYCGIVHDSQLYSGLVLNRIDPDFLSDDLFFRYGSQDKYSLFSPIMAPFVVALGNKTAFFIGYVLSISLFLTALTRLVLKVWPGSPAAIVGLIHLAVIQVPYGGHVPLNVIEPFLSARVPACGLALWAFSDILERRWLRGALAMAVAFGIHPLMTLPVMMILALVFLARRWGALGVAVPTVLSLGAFGAILATPSIATPLFGHFDAYWLELTQETNCYMFPQEWFAWQWFWNLFTLFGLAVAAYVGRVSDPSAWKQANSKTDGSETRPTTDTDRTAILAGAVLVGVAGFFGTLLFSQLPYALLLKGQAYRWLWLPLALMPPAFCHLAWQAWRTDSMLSRLAALGLAIFLGMTTYHWLEVLCLVFFLPVTYYAALVFAKHARLTDKVVGAVAVSMLLGGFLWGGFRVWVFFTKCTAIQGELTPLNLFAIAVVNLGAAIIIPSLLLALAAFGHRLFSVKAWTPVAVALTLQTTVTIWMATDNYKELNPNAEELQFVDAFLRERKAGQSQPLSIYCNYGRLYQYWIEWGTRSYYDCFQLAGFVFNRDTAVEGKRRALLVAPFEAVSLAKGRWEMIPDGVKEKIEAWHQTDIANTQPTEADVLALVHESSIDYLVLFSAHFDNLACARRGDVSIYDCRQLREKQVAAR
jgi:hypothetical protein